MTVAEKVSYIKGLAEGLGVDDSTKEGKVIAAIVDVLDDIALTLGDIDEELDDVADVMTDMEESVDCLEDVVYGDDEDDYDDCDCDDCCDEDDFDDDMYEVTCPSCGNTITVDFDVIQSGEIPCPNCGETLEFDLSCLEDEECDCGCHHDHE